MFPDLARKIGLRFGWLRDHPNERSNGVYSRVRKMPQAVNGSARVRHAGEIFGLARRPGEVSTAKKVQMNVKNRLPCGRVAVHHDTVTVLVKPLLLRQFLGNEM